MPTRIAASTDENSTPKTKTGTTYITTAATYDTPTTRPIWDAVMMAPVRV